MANRVSCELGMGSSKIKYRGREITLSKTSTGRYTKGGFRYEKVFHKIDRNVIEQFCFLVIQFDFEK